MPRKSCWSLSVTSSSNSEGKVKANAAPRAESEHSCFPQLHRNSRTGLFLAAQAGAVGGFICLLTAAVARPCSAKGKIPQGILCDHKRNLKYSLSSSEYLQDMALDLTLLRASTHLKQFFYVIRLWIFLNLNQLQTAILHRVNYTYLIHWKSIKSVQIFLVWYLLKKNK